MNDFLAICSNARQGHEQCLAGAGIEREPRPDDLNLEEFTTIISLISGERNRISQLIRESLHEENKERLARVAHLDTIISKLKSKLWRSG